MGWNILRQPRKMPPINDVFSMERDITCRDTPTTFLFTHFSSKYFNFTPNNTMSFQITIVHSKKCVHQCFLVSCTELFQDCLVSFCFFVFYSVLFSFAIHLFLLLFFVFNFYFYMFVFVSFL